MEDLEKLYQAVRGTRAANSKFIVLQDGESFVGEYQGCAKSTGQYGEQVSFYFLVDGDKKTLNKKLTSIRLLAALVNAKVKLGDVVKVTRVGDRTDTDYRVETMQPGAVPQEEVPKDELNQIFSEEK